MRRVFPAPPLLGKEKVGQQAASGTASIHAGYSRPTNDLGGWDNGGQVPILRPAEVDVSHLIHLGRGDVGRIEPACTLVVPRLLAVPRLDHGKRDDGGGIDSGRDHKNDGVILINAKSLTAVLVSMHPGRGNGPLSLSEDDARASASGARHAVD